MPNLCEGYLKIRGKKKEKKLSIYMNGNVVYVKK